MLELLVAIAFILGAIVGGALVGVVGLIWVGREIQLAQYAIATSKPQEAQTIIEPPPLPSGAIRARDIGPREA